MFAGPVTERVAVPSGWEKHAAAGDHETVSLQFALKWKHSGSIEQELEKTSDPDSSSYLQHLSKNQVLHMLQPCNGAGDAVKRWLEEHKVPSNAIVSSASGDSVTVQVPVHQASKMLKTKFSVYQHTGSKTTGVRTTQYTLPSGLDDFVEYVGGATQRFSPEEVATREFATISSGGGFSYYFPRPKYQDEVVPGYLKKLGNTFHGKFNPNGRAYPDLSAQGANYEIAWHQQFDTFSGTSASTPLAASFFCPSKRCPVFQEQTGLGLCEPPDLQTPQQGPRF